MRKPSLKGVFKSIANMKDRDLRKAISRSLANYCTDAGPSGGEAKKAARPPSGRLPERPNRAEEQLPGKAEGKNCSRTEKYCRVVGFIPLPQGRS